jgi:hypothetical protein
MREFFNGSRHAEEISLYLLACFGVEEGEFFRSLDAFSQNGQLKPPT